MGYYSDPTANMALGQINKEFSRLEKKAKALRNSYEKGRISQEDLAKAQSGFTGLYRHVLTNVLEHKDEEKTK